MYLSVYEELPEVPPHNPDCAHPGSYRQLGFAHGHGYGTWHTCLDCGAKWHVWFSRSEQAG